MSRCASKCSTAIGPCSACIARSTGSAMVWSPPRHQQLAVARQLAGAGLDLADGLADVERVDRQVTGVGDLLGAERRHLQRRVVRAAAAGTLPGCAPGRTGRPAGSSPRCRTAARGRRRRSPGTSSRRGSRANVGGPAYRGTYCPSTGPTVTSPYGTSTVWAPLGTPCRRRGRACTGRVASMVRSGGTVTDTPPGASASTARCRDVGGGDVGGRRGPDQAGLRDPPRPGWGCRPSGRGHVGAPRRSSGAVCPCQVRRREDLDPLLERAGIVFFSSSNSGSDRPRGPGRGVAALGVVVAADLGVGHRRDGWSTGRASTPGACSSRPCRGSPTSRS